MNINASNPSLINILLQQASKSQEKKRPTFEEVFAKLNARTARMDANKNPINNMLTNEQLFRYYIKDTDPKLRISNDSFNVEDALNPMRESDPNKIYGRATTQISDIIPSRNPYNYAENIGIPQAAQAAQAANRPISTGFSAAIQQYAGANTPFAMPPQPRIPSAAPAAPAAPDPTAYPDISGSIPIPIGSDAVIIDYNMAKEEYERAGNVIARLSEIDWGAIPTETSTIFSILFNNDMFYVRQTTEYMKQLIRNGTIDDALDGINLVFKQTKGNPAVNEFITERIAQMMGIDFEAGPAQIEKFNKQFNPNNIGIGEGKIGIDRFKVNVLNYLNSQGMLTGNEKLVVDREILNIEDRGIGSNANKYIGEINNRFQALQIRYDALMPSPTALMADLFFDGDTEIRTNTDINSVEIDPQLVKKLDDRNKAVAAGGSRRTSRPSPISLPSLPSASSAESSAGVDIDNVIERRGRGVQPGDIRGSYNKPKKIAQDILGDVIEGALSRV
jgi:hypothetical protein